MIELFDPTQVIYGGRPTRGYKITCKCGKIEKTHFNSLHGKAETGDERTGPMVSRKFTDMGWRVGATPGKHRCPACIKAETPAKLGDVIRQLLAKLKEPTVPIPDLTPAPREMSREDRRLIFEKLNEVYGDEKTGYIAPWTDKQVAEDMGVPRAWVASLREEMFGPEGSNPAIEALIAEAKAHLAAAQEMRARVTEDIRLSSARADEINRRLAAIEKAVRP